MLSGTELSGCKGKDMLPFLASGDYQGSHDQIIVEVTSHISRWISDVASTMGIAILDLAAAPAIFGGNDFMLEHAGSTCKRAGGVCFGAMP